MPFQNPLRPKYIQLYHSLETFHPPSLTANTWSMYPLIFTHDMPHSKHLAHVPYDLHTPYLTANTWPVYPLVSTHHTSQQTLGPCTLWSSHTMPHSKHLAHVPSDLHAPCLTANTGSMYPLIFLKSHCSFPIAHLFHP